MLIKIVNYPLCSVLFIFFFKRRMPSGVDFPNNLGNVLWRNKKFPEKSAGRHAFENNDLKFSEVYEPKHCTWNKLCWGSNFHR